MTVNKQRQREIQERISAKRAERQESLSQNSQQPSQGTRIMLLLNGINPLTGTPFTIDEFNKMREKVITPEQLHIYRRIEAGNRGLGRAFDEFGTDPFYGMSAEDFRKRMDEFYISLGWT